MSSSVVLSSSSSTYRLYQIIFVLLFRSPGSPALVRNEATDRHDGHPPAEDMRAAGVFGIRFRTTVEFMCPLLVVLRTTYYRVWRDLEKFLPECTHVDLRTICMILCFILHVYFDISYHIMGEGSLSSENYFPSVLCLLVSTRTCLHVDVLHV